MRIVFFIISQNYPKNRCKNNSPQTPPKGALGTEGGLTSLNR